MNDSVVAIVSAFFVIGIAVGIITVVAISVLRADRLGAQHEQDEAPDPGRDDVGDRPCWPGDVDSHFGGR